MKDIERARAAVARQLARREVVDREQVACLKGMLCALEWVEGVGGKALQHIVDGRNIQLNYHERASNKTFFKPGDPVVKKVLTE